MSNISLRTILIQDTLLYNLSRNKLTNPISEFEVKIFEQRKHNLLTAEKLYKDLQREALSISKKQALSR